MTAAASTFSPPPAPPQLRLARLEDHEQISRLETSRDMETYPYPDWSGRWLDNPLWPRLSRTWPIGWVLEDTGGKIVGSMINIPSRYVFRGRELLCAIGRSWVVADEYRTFAPWLMDEYFQQDGVDLLYNTRVGSKAASIVGQLANRVPLGDWQAQFYWVTGYRASARRALRSMGAAASLISYPAAAGLWVKDAIVQKLFPKPPPSVEVEEVHAFDSRFDPFWQELQRKNPDKLLAARDTATLAWHYAKPIRSGRLWVFLALRGGLLRGYLVVKRHDQAEGVPRMRVIDYQSVEDTIDLLPCLLRAARARCIAEGYCILDHLGGGIPKMRSLDELAPYRRTLATWPFYYQAPDPALKSELSKPEVWDPSLFDGDTSFE